MKTLILISTITCLVLFGCKKDSSTPAAPPVTPVINMLIYVNGNYAVAGISGGIYFQNAQATASGTLVELLIGTDPKTNEALKGSLVVSGQYFSIVEGDTAANNVYISPGSSQTWYLSFNPRTTGNFRGTLTITHNATNMASPIVATLYGTGD